MSANSEAMTGVGEGGIVGRDLFGVYLAAMLGTLIDSFPEECRIDLDQFAGPEPVNLSRLDYMHESTRRSAEWEAEQLAQDRYTAACNQRRQKVRIARGTLIFALKADLIDSPGREEFLRTNSQSYLNDCILTAKGYAALFRKPDQSIEHLMQSVAQKVGGTEESGRQTATLFSLVSRIVKDQAREQIKEQVKDVVKDQLTLPTGAALNTILATTLASLTPMLHSAF